MNPDDPDDPHAPAGDADRPADPDAAGSRGGMPTAVKVLVWTVVIALAIVVLFGWVFPWVESMQQDPTLGG